MNIDDFFEKFVENKKDYIEKIKRENKKKDLIFVIALFSIIPMFYIYILILQVFIQSWIIIVLSAIMTLAPFIYLRFSKNNGDYITYLKKEILTPFFNYCFNNINYKMNEPFSKEELKHICKYLFFKWGIHSNDSIEIRINNKNINVTNVYYYYNRNIGRHSTQEKGYGLVIKIPINNYNDKKISIIPNKYCSDLSVNGKNILMKILKMPFKVYQSPNNIEFNNIYTFYNSENEITGKNENFIKKLLEISRQYKFDDTRICIINNYCYVLINGKNMMNVCYNSLRGGIDINLTNDLIIDIKKQNFRRIHNNILSIQNIIIELLDLEQYI